ncbi:MAG: flagellar biosynthesis anti-sigma factor FlgM [Syntrophobacteraceae bacterium]|jgi:negative regulator of flagellin synthesis FlgM
MAISKIPPYLTNAVSNSGAAAGKTGAQEKTTAGNGVSSDRVQLSKDYQDLAQAQKAVAGTDEVRTAMVQQIKSQLESGSYQVNPGAIAGKMLDEII